MKHGKLRITLAVIISVILLAGQIAGIYFAYHFANKYQNADIIKWFWIALILSVFVIDATCGLIVFNGKFLSDELKAFWLFIILILPLSGAILWLFLGIRKQQGYGYGQSGQTTLLSHLFKAKKSVKIYTNSFFVSYDTYKALNYISWKNVKVDVVLSFDKKKRKNKVLKYDINKFLEPKINIHFTNKEIEHNFIIIDDKEVLFNDKNFNYKYMYSKTKMYLAEDSKGYITLWNKDFVKTSLYDHDQSKPAWPIRMKYGIINIFYPFF